MITTIEMPKRIAALPRDQQGRPVPYFVTWIEGKPDFRIVDETKRDLAYCTRVCFICGQKLGTYLAFAIGPINTVLRINAEPPNHLECAKYATQICPFLTQPKRLRRTQNMPEGFETPSDLVIEHNPGVTAIWVTRRFELVLHKNGLLAHLDEPTQVLWYKEGRLATRDEVTESCIDSVKRFYSATSEEIGPAIEKAKRYWPKH